MSEPNEGWYHPRTSKRSHYVRRQRTLCGRYGAHGVKDLRASADFTGMPACSSCEKKLEAEKGA